jgi:predicted O-linked N-acetylglucosamine transferase (SPINDLY family)
MDYILADRYVIPAAAESHYRENVLRMPNEYLCLAMGLADDLSRLAKWRAELRERMARSPLCDGPRFAGNLMNLLRGIWREWCLGP